MTSLTLPNGKPIRGDFVVSATLRYALEPIPSTLEATIRLDDTLEPHLREGKTILAGREQATYRIVWVNPNKQAQGVQGSRLMGSVSFIALLDSCAEVSFKRRTAVIKNGATLGGIYRACGATARIESDFVVPRFACLIGDTPTFGIARALQEEGGALAWTGRGLKFWRLPDLFKQKPVTVMATDTAEDIQSGFLERHEVPAFYSVAPDGSIIWGNRSKERAARFLPGADERTLRNATRALVYRKILTSTQAQHVYAGDMVTMAGTPYAVVYAVHVHESGTDGGGNNDYSRLWLATLEE